MSIQIEKIVKTFGSFHALKGVSLEMGGGDLVALLGPSGCGKTTLLRIIAGLEKADSGRIFFQGEDATHRNVKDREVGFVFQHYALFKHMSVFENVAFGLRVRPRSNRPSEPEIRDRVHHLLDLVQLAPLKDRFPSELSGGQRQRIALVRALAVEPRILLLDEPFGALDAKVRKDLRRWLRKLHDELHVTSVFVTHDQEEALEVADQIVVLNEGQVEQVGTPQQVYDDPASRFVSEFLGEVNLFHGRLQDGHAHVEDSVFKLAGDFSTSLASAVFFARPHEIEVLKEIEGSSGLPARIMAVRTIGSGIRIEAERMDDGGMVEVLLPRETQRESEFRVGDRIMLVPRRLNLFKGSVSGPVSF